MSALCLIDTSVFVNLLNVPHMNEQAAQVFQDYRVYVEAECTFILPMATIIETGNHIAQNGNGTLRRATALRFVNVVNEAFSNNPPFRLSEFPQTQDILRWLNQFPDFAGQNKTPNKQEGTSFGDLSIIKEFEKACNRFPMTEIFIWSFDQDLQVKHQHKR